MVADIDAVNREDNEVLTALANLTKALAAVETYRPPEKSLFLLSTAEQASHVRMRVYDFVFTVTVAAVVTLSIGGRDYSFPVSAADSKAFALPVLIDRGQDVSLTTSVGTVFGYLTYTPE